MDLEFDKSASRLKKEQSARLAKEKKKREADRLAQLEVAKRNEAIEEQNRLRRLQQAEEEAKALQAQEEHERRTGGVEWKESFVSMSTGLEGDRITLPPSALSGLEFKGAMDQKGPMHFELTTEHGARTHCGVLEFVAEDGKIGLPSKVASCLAAVTNGDETPEGGYNTRVTATYVRLEKGTFVSLQPRTRDFATAMMDVRGSSVPVYDSARGKWVLPGLEGILHQSLQPLCALTTGDTVRVTHAGSSFDLDVVQLEPASQVSLIDTDIQVEINPSKEEVDQMERGKQEQEAAALAKAAKDEEAALRAQNASSRLVEEPPEGADGVVTFAVRLPDGSRYIRRVLRSHQLQVLFDAIDARGVLGTYSLVASFPRRVFDHSNATTTVEEAGFVGPQEGLHLEMIS